MSASVCVKVNCVRLDDCVSHTVPHTPSTSTSRRPICGESPPTSRISEAALAAGNRVNLSYEHAAFASCCLSKRSFATQEQIVTIIKLQESCNTEYQCGKHHFSLSSYCPCKTVFRSPPYSWLWL